MNRPVRVISSMATRHVLGDLAGLFRQRFPYEVTIESVGGVVAAQRVRDGAPFDVAVLAADAIDRLAGEGRVLAARRVAVLRSGIAVAVRAGAPRPDIGSEAALRGAVAAARTIGYSTGPSGAHLQQLFERWGMADALRARTVGAPPGVPVAALIADGRVELGFQQLSEMIHEPGIDVLGPLPADLQAMTVFAAAPVATAPHTAGTDAWLAFLADPETAPIKRRHGTEPADRGPPALKPSQSA